MFREDDLGLATRAKWFPSVAPSHLSGRHEEVVKRATVWFQLVRISSGMRAVPFLGTHQVPGTKF